jgi:hypothetical protein
LTRVADKYRIRGKQENNFRKGKKMKEVEKEVFFQYIVLQGLKNIRQEWSNHTSSLTLSYVKRGKERAKIVQGPKKDFYFVSTK